MRFFILLFVLFAISQPAGAQTKYSAWSDPDQKAGTTGGTAARDLIQRLDKLIDEAEKSRAANPAFLRDLRDLARSYDAPASKPGIRTVLSDDFGDGNFNVNPAWTVTGGRYWVEKGWGLRSAVPVQDSNQPQQKTKKNRNRDTAIALLGAVLGQSSGGSTSTTTTATTATAQEVAGIFTPAAIANAFALDIEFSSWIQDGQPAGGSFEIGPYQGTDRASGYRLSYTPGRGLTLLIVSPKGNRVIDQQAGPMALEDKKTHAVRWTRDIRGRMSVGVDGREILSTVDRGFGDPFQGLALNNGGGDYIVKRITVSSGG